MQSVLVFEYFAFDTANFCGTPKHYFTGTPNATAKATSVTSRAEKDNQLWLFRRHEFRAALCRKLALDPLDTDIRQHVPQARFTRGNGGSAEVDCVCIQRRDYTKATCIEFKNFKVAVSSDGSSQVRDLSRIAPLVRQGNARQSMGFHRVFICAIVAVDTSHASNGETNILFRHGGSSRERILYNIDKEEEIHQDVGFLVCEILQPSSKSVDQFAGVGVALAKDAISADQRPALTNDIKRIFRIGA